MTEPDSNARGQAAAVVGVLAGLALALAGCATGTPSTTPTSSTLAGTEPSGVTFSAPRTPVAGFHTVALACGAPGSCLALDGTGHFLQLGAGGWSQGGTIPGTGSVAGQGSVALACASPSMCVADPSASGQVSTWNGKAFEAPTTLQGANGIEAIGCAPTGYCAAVDAEGNSYSFAGSWQRTAGDWGSVAAISCVSSSFCVSASGGLSMWNGSRWSSPQDEGAKSSFTGVSCPTANFCIAVDAAGEALQWDGSSWGAPTTIEPAASSPSSLGPSPTDVSCASSSSSFCVAVDSEGAVLQWVRGRWTRKVVDGTSGLIAVSCPSPLFCAALDQQGLVSIAKS